MYKNNVNYEILNVISKFKEEQEKMIELRYTIMKYSLKIEKDKFSELKQEANDFLEYFNDNNNNIKLMFNSVYNELKHFNK